MYGILVAQLLLLNELCGSGFSGVSGAYLNGKFPATDPALGSAQVPALLSATGAFSDLVELVPVAGLVPYEVNSPLWSDGALKRRWLAVPSDGARNSAGEQIVFRLDEPWTFPAGTVAVKHFELPNDEGNPALVRRLETRFLVALPGGDFYGLTYRWRVDGSDADLVTGTVSDTVAIREADGGTRSQVWNYPTRSDCRFCHNAGAGVFLGLRTWQLNREVEGIGNQITEWGQDGLFSGLAAYSNGWPRGVAVDDVGASLEVRSKSYFAANCASCHNENDELGTTFALDFHVPIAEGNVIDEVPLYDLGNPEAKVVKAGDPDGSVLYERMATVAAHRMPPIGRNEVDQVALDTVRAWIMTLQPAGTASGNPPIARDDEVLTRAGQSITIAALANDTDVDGDDCNFLQATEVSSGTLVWNGNLATYTPATGFTGVVSFRYQIQDTTGLVSDEAVVRITVAPAEISSEVAFVDGSAKLGEPSSASGVAMGVVDMDQDGLDDIIHFDLARDLYVDRQKANGDFESNLLGSTTGLQWGMAVGDYDNNGFPDIVHGGYYDGLHQYLADGLGRSYTRSLDMPSMFTQAINLADMNRDGLLDVFICNDEAESIKMRNTGAGELVADASLINTRTIPVSDNSGNYGSVWTDYDGDGDLDLYISKCRSIVSNSADPRRINQLFRNDGTSGFTEVAAAAGLADGAQSWAADFADIDNDGDLDCFIGNHMSQSRMMRNNGDGTFSDVTLDSGVDCAWNIIQVVFRDFNCDGWIDLLLTGVEHGLWLNDGDGSFTPADNPFTSDWIESCAVGDLNADGFEDVYAGYAKLYNKPQEGKPDKLFLSEPNGNNFLAVNLRGRASNRLATGARLELKGPWGTQVREVRSGESYGVTHSLTNRFGMGDVATATELRVRWPSGQVDVAKNLSANTTYLLNEGDTTPPIFTSVSNQQNAAASLVSLQLQATDPHGNALQYTATGLPTGLSINRTTGLISGKTANVGGVFPVTLSVTDGWSTVSQSITWTILPSSQSPYGGSPHPIPGKIEAEDYDLGGEGIAYHDREPANLSGAYRNEGVDIEESGDSDNSFSLGWFDAGEWLEYTVEVTPGLYEITLRTAAGEPSPGGLRLTLDGKLVTDISTPDTGAYNLWASTTASGIWIRDGGNKILRAEALGNGINLNWLDFKRPSGAQFTGETSRAAFQSLLGNAQPTWSYRQSSTGLQVYFPLLSGGAWQGQNYQIDGLTLRVECSRDLLNWTEPLTRLTDSLPDLNAPFDFETCGFRPVNPLQKAFFRLVIDQAD